METNKLTEIIKSIKEAKNGFVPIKPPISSFEKKGFVPPPPPPKPNGKK